MRGQHILAWIEDQGWCGVTMDGFDDAVVGYVETEVVGEVAVVYSVDECLAILGLEMTEAEALDYFYTHYYPPSVPAGLGAPPLLLETEEESAFLTSSLVEELYGKVVEWFRGGRGGDGDSGSGEPSAKPRHGKEGRREQDRISPSRP